MSPLKNARQGVGMKEMKRIVMVMLARELVYRLELWRTNFEQYLLTEGEWKGQSAALIQSSIRSAGLRLHTGRLAGEREVDSSNRIKGGVLGCAARKLSNELKAREVHLSAMILQGSILGQGIRNDFSTDEISDAMLGEAWLLGQISIDEYVIKCKANRVDDIPGA